MLAPDNYPSLKISGEVVFLNEYGKNTPSELNQEILSIIPEKLKKQFADELELDFAITLK
jgi:Tfp pilus assembly pilus retraction ATPase PilT